MAEPATTVPSRSASTITLAVIVLLALLSMPSGRPGPAAQVFNPDGPQMQAPADPTRPGVNIRVAGADIVGDGKCAFIFTPHGDSVPVGDCG
jgi:hypothetical protein